MKKVFADRPVLGPTRFLTGLNVKLNGVLKVKRRNEILKYPLESESQKKSRFISISILVKTTTGRSFVQSFNDLRTFNDNDDK